MRSASTPEHYANVTELRAVRLAATSSTCRCCTDDKVVGHVYEQTTYPEWAFSDYRTGTTPRRCIAVRAAARRRSRARTATCRTATPTAIRIAARSPASRNTPTFPQAEHTLPADGHRPAGARRIRQAHARRAEPVPAQDGPAVPRRARHPHPGSDAHRRRRRSVALHREGDARPGGASAPPAIIVARHRRSTPDAAARASPSSTRPATSFRRGVGFRRAFIEFSVLDVSSKRAVVVRAAPTRPASSSTGRVPRSPANCGGSRIARRASTRRRASISRTTRSIDPAGPGADLSGAGGGAARRGRAGLRRRRATRQGR